MLKNGCRRAMNNYSISDQSALITTAWIWEVTFTFVGFMGIITPRHRLNFPFMTFTEKRLLSVKFSRAAVMVDFDEISHICRRIAGAQASNHCALDV